MNALIRNVTIVGGTGAAGTPTDVFVAGDKISAIGSFPQKSADAVVDGQGGYLAPGFIDIAAETDHYLGLFTNPDQDGFLRQGVTTIFGGGEGASLAPLIYGNLDTLEEWLGGERANVDWHTMREFLETLDRHPTGVHFGSFVGHATIRSALIGSGARDLTKNELAIFERILGEALREGGFGLSAGLKNASGKGASYPELRALGRVTKNAGGIFRVSLRKGASSLGASLGEILRLAAETDAPTIIAHLMPTRGEEAEYERALEVLSAPQYAHVYFDLAPFAWTPRPLYRFLPDWAQAGTIADMAKRLEDEWLRERIVKDLSVPEAKKFMVARAYGHEAIVGKTLEDLVAIYGVRKPAEALLLLLRRTGLRGVALLDLGNEALTRQALTHPRALIGSRGVSSVPAGKPGWTIDPGRGEMFPEIIRRAIREGAGALEDAVCQITKVPASLLGLKNRGVIREGALADLVCFDRDGAPKATLVGGRIAWRDGERVGVRAGRALRRNRP